MPVEHPMTMDDVLGGQLEPGLVAAHGGSTDLSGVNCDRMTLLVGPEGGLTPVEQRALESAGWSTISLGPHVLRGETAAVVGAAVLTMKMQAGHR